MNNGTETQFVKAGEMGDILGGVKATQVRRWAKCGMIPALVLPSGRLVFNPKEVITAMKTNIEQRESRHE